VDVRVSKKKDWALDGAAFERLLAALDPERERAGERYEILRRRLIELFEARGCAATEDLADETLNRVARKLGEGEEVRDVGRYAYGVARLLLLERFRAKAMEPLQLEEVSPPAVEAADAAVERERELAEREALLECFERCLSLLPEEGRAFLVEYYREEKGAKIEARKEQARRLGIPLNALRLRACRLRSRLERCVRECAGD
jgi:DNA-directed RNA polymerase specialized sigma24 family protein